VFGPIITLVRNYQREREKERERERERDREIERERERERDMGNTCNSDAFYIK
jgi:hypothetical protein